MLSSILVALTFIGCWSSGSACIGLRVEGGPFFEGDTVNICVDFSEATTTPGSFFIQANLIGVRDPRDYSIFPVNMSVPVGQMASLCSAVETAIDRVIEEVDFITVALSSSGIDICSAGPRSAIILIRDNTRLPLSFTSPSFSGTEGQSVSVCVSAPPGYSVAGSRTISFSIESVQGLGSQDFPSITSRQITSSDLINSSSICSLIALFPDDFIEDDESYSLTITSSGGVIEFDGNNSILNILNINGASVRLLNLTDEVVEGNNGSTSVMGCIQLLSTDALLRDAVFALNVVESSSANSLDHLSLPRNITIPVGSPTLSMVCFTVEILGDNIMEDNEELVISLTPTNRNDVTTNSNFTIIILDDGDSIIIMDTTTGPLMDAPSTVPIISAPSSSNTRLIVGLVVGIGLFILLLAVVVVIGIFCYIYIQKKKNFKKYVLPYRNYMYSNQPGVTDADRARGDIQRWEDDRPLSVIEAVESLDADTARSKQ